MHEGNKAMAWAAQAEQEAVQRAAAALEAAQAEAEAGGLSGAAKEQALQRAQAQFESSRRLAAQARAEVQSVGDFEA